MSHEKSSPNIPESWNVDVVILTILIRWALGMTVSTVWLQSEEIITRTNQEESYGPEFVYFIHQLNTTSQCMLEIT